MDNKIKIAVPGMWTHFDITKKLIFFMQSCPEAVRENFCIGAVYDNFPYCIWDGGRVFNQYSYASLENIVEVKQFFNEHGIPIRLVFTNPEIKEMHLHDRFCNLVAQACENDMNEIVVNNTLLEQHLRENYPKYNYISSTTRCNLFENSLAEIDTNQYKYICLDYNQNHNFKELDKLSQPQKDQVEFLCNAICPPGCPSRKEHYRLNGLFYLGYMRKYSVPECGIRQSLNHPAAMSFSNNISPEEIERIYAKKGFTMFKLEGRTLPDLQMILSAVRYLIKPEYQYFCLEAVLSAE